MYNYIIIAGIQDSNEQLLPPGTSFNELVKIFVDEFEMNIRGYYKVMMS